MGAEEGNIVKSELPEWLARVTGQPDEAIAKRVVENSIAAVREFIPKIGVVTLVTGPGGLMDFIVSQNLDNEDGYDQIEMALLDFQRRLVEVRKARKEQERTQAKLTQPQTPPPAEQAN